MNLLQDWLSNSAAPINEAMRQCAINRQQQLTKPSGSLGRLEVLAIQLAAMQATQQPAADRIHMSIFAADHGVAAEGISAFPQAVTAEMIRNFAHGGAAISVLAKELEAQLEIINLGTVNELETLDHVINQRITAGTANFTRQAAMSSTQLLAALDAGQQAVRRAQHQHTQLFIAGEMGIGNTTSAAAVACSLLEAPAKALAGPGTGLDNAGVSHKVNIIQKGLDLHQAQIHSALEALRCLGGFEIAALTGGYISCARWGVPVLIDGFICSVAALCANQLCRNASDWFIYSHTSAEPGHQRVLQALDAQPLLNLAMRLGEASGAAVAVPLIRLACRLHNEMATFKEAQVSEKQP